MGICTKFFNTGIIILMMMALSSCLPVQKKTQCGENEAFNATKRQCVPVLGSSTSNTIFVQTKFPANSYTTSGSGSPQTHTITVSDSYQYGYTVKWYLHYQNTSLNQTITTTVSATTAYTFDPTSRPSGQYIIEAVVYDENGANQLDSVTWNVTISAASNPTLSSPSPNAAAYSYPDTTTSANLSVTIANPDGVSYRFQRIVDGTTAFTSSTITSASSVIVTQNINPSTLNHGLHTVEVRVYEATNAANVYASYVWLVNIIDPDLPVIQTTLSTPSLAETITVIDGVQFSNNGWRDSLNNSLYAGGTGQICVRVDDSDKDSTFGPDINVNFYVSSQSIGTAAETSAGSNIFCLTAAQVNTAQNYFNLSNPDVSEARSLNVTTTRVSNGAIVESLSWNVAIRPRNVRPEIALNVVTDGHCSSSGSNVGTCTVEQSTNYDRGTDADYEYSGPTDNDNRVIFGIEITNDPDITAETHYKVDFAIKRTSPTVDASSQALIPTGSYTDANCVFAAGDTAAGLGHSKLQCPVYFDSFGDNGPIDPGTYEVTATITDAGNGTGYDTNGNIGVGTPKTSNIITWNVTVTEAQETNSITIGAFSTVPGLTGSWMQTSAGCDGSTITDTFTENDVVYICTRVRDLERDNFIIWMEMSNAFLSTQSALVSQSLITRSNGDEYIVVESVVQIPEWVVTTGTSATLEVNVSDRPYTYNAISNNNAATATATYAITVANNNPPPTFADNSAEDLTGQFTFPGLPYSIAVSTSDFSDASQYDGDEISWQWLVSTDAGTTWTNIANANSDNQSNPTLVWTPDQDLADGALVSFRLCLADNGVAHNILNCNQATTLDGLAGPMAVSVKHWTGLTVYKNNTRLSSTDTNASSGNELAQWYDATDSFLYTAYTTGTKIYVEKLNFNSVTGAFESVNTISFDTEDSIAGKIPVTADRLTMTGVDSTAVLISYRVIESTTGSPQFRVRRIDTSHQKLNFSYCGFYTQDDTFSAPHTTCEDLYQQGANDIDQDANVSYNSSATGNLDVVFADVPADAVNNNSVTLINSAGNAVSYKYGAADNLVSDPIVIGYCNPSCADINTTAQALANAIANSGATHADADLIAKEFAVDGTSVIGTVSIYGPSEFDYYDDEIRITTALGRINVNPATGVWYLPYANGASSSRLGLASGSGALSATGLNSGIVSHTAFATSGADNTELDNEINTTLSSIYIGTKNNNANLSMYKINYSGVPVINAVANDVYLLSNYDRIENIRVSIGSDNYVYASSISVGNSGSTRDLSAAIFYNDLASYKGNASIVATGYDQYVQNIQRAHISAHPATKGEAVVLVTTTTSNVNVNKAYAIKLNFTLGNLGNSSDLVNTNSFNFHDYNYPALNNAFLSVNEGAIHATSMIQLTDKSYSSTTAGAADLDRYVSFMAIHESDTDSKIKTGFINTQTESVQTDDTTVSGNYPAFIGNN